MDYDHSPITKGGPKQCNSTLSRGLESGTIGKRGSTTDEFNWIFNHLSTAVEHCGERVDHCKEKKREHVVQRSEN